MNTVDIVWKGIEEGVVALILYGLMYALWYVARGTIRDASGPWYVYVFLVLFALFIIFTIGWECCDEMSKKVFYSSKYLTVGVVLISFGALSGWDIRRGRKRFKSPTEE